MNMENQDWTSAWSQLQSRVERLETVQRSQTARELEREWSARRKALRMLPVADLISAGLVLVTAIGFLGSRFAEVLAMPWYGAPAAMLAVLAFVLVQFGARCLIAASGLNDGLPVAEAQAELAAYEVLRGRVVQITVLAGLLGWFLIPMVFLQWVAGAEVIRELPAAWIAANVVFAAVAAALFSALWRGSRWSSALRSAMLGHEVEEARRFLDRVQSFVREAA
jgi:hypothetical protein